MYFCFLIFSFLSPADLVSKSSPTLMIPWIVAHQDPLSIRFRRQEYWNGLSFASQGDLPNPMIEPGTPALQADSLPTEPLGEPQKLLIVSLLSFFLHLFHLWFTIWDYFFLSQIHFLQILLKVCWWQDSLYCLKCVSFALFLIVIFQECRTLSWQLFFFFQHTETLLPPFYGFLCHY